MSLLDDLADRWTPEPNTGCYLWHGWTNGRGYARTRAGVVSRLVCAETYGPPPSPRHEAAHNTPNGCIGGLCVNDGHLRWATHRENFYDTPPQKRSERMYKINALKTSEERSAIVRKTVAAQTPEQHSERARKGWETRRARP